MRNMRSNLGKRNWDRRQVHDNYNASEGAEKYFLSSRVYMK
jgi:hypothetical protein